MTAQPAQQNDSSEVVFYQDNYVTVTQSRFVVANKTYAMRNISSVSVDIIRKRATLQLILFFIGLFMCVLEPEVRLLGAAVAVCSFIWMMTLRDKYAIRISSNAGEINGLISANKTYVQQVINAVNEAIIYRG